MSKELYTYIHTYIHTWISTHSHEHIHNHAFMHIDICTHACAYCTLAPVIFTKQPHVLWNLCVHMWLCKVIAWANSPTYCNVKVFGTHPFHVVNGTRCSDEDLCFAISDHFIQPIIVHDLFCSLPVSLRMVRPTSRTSDFISVIHTVYGSGIHTDTYESNSLATI